MSRILFIRSMLVGILCTAPLASCARPTDLDMDRLAALEKTYGARFTFM